MSLSDLPQHPLQTMSVQTSGTGRTRWTFRVGGTWHLVDLEPGDTMMHAWFRNPNETDWTYAQSQALRGRNPHQIALYLLDLECHKAGV